MGNNKISLVERLIISICIGMLILLSITIIVRFFTRQILVERFDMCNTFTELVWFDNNSLSKSDTNENVDVNIKWEEEYPFYSDDNNSNINGAESKNNTCLGKFLGVIEFISNTVMDIEEKIETYTTNYIIFHSKFLECANSYEMLLGWNFAPYDEYNAVVELSDGYLSVYRSKKDTSQQYESLLELNEFCKKRDINFVYIQAPYKISEYDDTDVSGKLDYTNQNADELLAYLESADIDNYDIRNTIHEENISNRELFFNTDHHWKATTGLWASQKILSFCNSAYDWNADLSLLDGEQFEYVTYKDWFLGSQGKKFTLSRCNPDDITLLYPKYDTKFHYYVPTKGIDTFDDYSIVYNMSAIEKCDYYNESPYAVFGYGNQPIIEIENQLYVDNHKILIIHDSFGNCVIPCLALAEKDVYALDIREFTGSVMDYIEKCNPDLVIVMYTASSAGGDIDYSSHEDEFDFR